MDRIILEQLRARRATIRKEWISLLRAEPVTTPLGNPEALQHLIDQTLDQVFADLGKEKLLPGGPTRQSYDDVLHECACGRNPLLAYFLTGERALLKVVFRVRMDLAAKYPMHNDTDLTEIYLVLRRIARREVKNFCALCQHGPRRSDERICRVRPVGCTPVNLVSESA